MKSCWGTGLLIPGTDRVGQHEGGGVVLQGLVWLADREQNLTEAVERLDLTARSPSSRNRARACFW